MAKIYYRRYKSLVRKGEMTLQEAIADAAENVPEEYRAEAVALLEADL